MTLDVVRALISASGSDRRSVEAVVAEVGRSTCADLVVSEISSRFTTPLSSTDEDVVVEVVLSGESRFLRVTSTGAEVSGPGDVDATISQDLCELDGRPDFIPPQWVDPEQKPLRNIRVDPRLSG
ncbi:hypothetical protein [Allokutzneria sp. NRRL B-24872]|uniref:hypothetical protein n=1 Tax=Allokutzneria sp. NRRL B-24872 TaxID=1137961 RepID=UPI000A3C4432|nr:hypothetical protein [Allokutzneria sp. NRRL B-24872]